MGTLSIGYLKVDQHAAVPDEGGRANLSPEDIRNSKNKRKKFEKTSNKLAIKEQAEAASLNESGGKKTDQGGGPGSRGGKVIGRTKSGKPIYQNHNHPSHQGFNPQEHVEAANKHLKVRNQLVSRTKDKKLPPDKRAEFKDHDKSMDHHASEAKKKSKTPQNEVERKNLAKTKFRVGLAKAKAEDKRKGDSMDLKIGHLKVDQSGEGSRGGKIIGRTKSGKPIYQNHNHPSHKGFSKEEHTQAVEANIRKLSGKGKPATDKEPGAKDKAHMEAIKHHSSKALS